uniref:Uncharacterized protein n=1 Tax=Acrobeloides nanus TaxID=290746 RepID=A0A914CQ66_9BILA
MAPFGSFLGSHFHRLVQASFIYILEIAALIGFLFTKPSWILIGVGVAIIFGGFVFFEILCRIGKSLVVEEDEQKLKPDDIA